MAKKKQTEYVESVHDQDYDRWSYTPGSVKILDLPEKATKKTGTKTVKKKK